MACKRNTLKTYTKQEREQSNTNKYNIGKQQDNYDKHRQKPENQ